jgi:hypothetical protein
MQAASFLPIDEALTVFDEIVAKQRHINWPADVARERLVAASDGTRIETGTAKRIISDAEAAQHFKMMATPGTREIKQRWNSLKTVEPST